MIILFLIWAVGAGLCTVSAGFGLMVMIFGTIIWAACSAQKTKQQKDDTLTKATETTTGRIIKSTYSGASGDADITYYWVIEYQVRGVSYKMSISDPPMSSREMKTHIGETVEVHYDPDSPGCAWAEAYGATGWHR